MVANRPNQERRGRKIFANKVRLAKTSELLGRRIAVSRTDYRTLVNRGRKAGLNTSELYRALAGRPPLTSDSFHGLADGNGFVAGYNQHGQPEFKHQGNAEGK
jgi:hypothetical protein